MSTKKVRVEDPVVEFPPYGFMNTTYEWDRLQRPMPYDFRVRGAPASWDQWEDFVEKIVERLADDLWPRYKRHSGWYGKATDKMLALTMGDLALSRALRDQHLFEPATINVNKQSIKLPVVHRALFEAEDLADGPLFPAVDFYMSHAPEWLRGQLKEAVESRLSDLGPAPIWFKREFQRPRAYQMSYILPDVVSGKHEQGAKEEETYEFQYELATSADTPSMISGHCLQGIVAFTGAFLDYRREIEEVPGGVASWLQLAVDYGDRRVFAGVHYPSDNIGSWFVAMKLCDHLYGRAANVASSFMWEAIAGHSLVYAAMKAEPFWQPFISLLVQPRYNDIHLHDIPFEPRSGGEPATIPAPRRRNRDDRRYAAATP
jgi:hypothetical protein